MKAENGLKKCSKCGEVKGVGEFGKVSVSPDGYRSCCKACFKLSVNIEKRKIYQSKYRKSEKGCKYVSNREYLDSLKKIRSTDEYKLRRREYQKCKKAKDGARRAGKISSELLKTSYIKICIRQKYGISFRDIPPKMIELKRTQLINKRLIKNLKENETK